MYTFVGAVMFRLRFARSITSVDLTPILLYFRSLEADIDDLPTLKIALCTKFILFLTS